MPLDSSADLVELRFGIGGEPKALEAIGKELGITRERVRQLEAEAFEHLAVELDGLAENDEEWAA